MAKINLANLKHKELPKKDIEIEIGGEIQQITIQPLTGRALTNISLLNENDLDRNSKMCLIALMNGLGLSQNEAELFMDGDTMAADTIAAAILSFTSEYAKEMFNAKSVVKKNIKKTTSQK